MIWLRWKIKLYSSCKWIKFTRQKKRLANEVFMSCTILIIIIKRLQQKKIKLIKISWKCIMVETWSVNVRKVKGKCWIYV